MNLQQEKLDVSANSIEPKGKYKKINQTKPKKTTQPKRRWKQPRMYSVLYEIKTHKRKENSTVWKAVRTVITMYAVEQLLTRVLFFLQRQRP